MPTSKYIHRLYYRATSLISQYYHGELDKEEFKKAFRMLEDKIIHETELKN